MRVITVLEEFRRELTLAFRTLGRAPKFTAAALLMITVGAGATTALFTIVRLTLLQPLPFPNPEQIVMIQERGDNGDSLLGQVAAGNFIYWKSRAKSFSEMGIWSSGGYNLSDRGGQLPEHVDAAAASSDLFSLLGVPPIAGRLFTTDDDQQGVPGTVVMTWGLWKRRYGSSTSILGSRVLLDSKPYTVVGVLPPWFSYPNTQIQLWTTIKHEYSPVVMEWHGNMPSTGNRRFGYSFNAIARLGSGIRIAQAQTELNGLQDELHTQFPDEIVARRVQVRSLLQSMVSGLDAPLYLLMAATTCLLVISTLNVANLLVARSASLRKQTAIRIALGAPRWRLVCQSITEATVLSVSGGVFSLAFAGAIVQWFVKSRSDIPRMGTVHLDFVALLFVLGLSLVTGLVAGTMPVLTGTEKSVQSALHGSSRSHSRGPAGARLRKILISLEFALTVLLLVTAGLFVKSYSLLRKIDLGCATKNILTMNIDLPSTKYKTPDHVVSFYEEVQTRIRTLPGVQNVGLATDLPGQGRARFEPFTIVELPASGNDVKDAVMCAIGPGLLATLQIPIMRGRDFSPTEKLGHVGAVIVNEAFVRKFFQVQDPLAFHLRMNNWASQAEGGYEIVGVSRDTRFRASEPPQPTIFFPLYSRTFNSVSLAVTSKQEITQLALPIQTSIAAIDPDLPVSDVLTMEQLSLQSSLGAAFDSELLVSLAVLSLVLAAVGLFGLLSYLVSQRANEIGIRVALGAQRKDVIGLVLLSGLKPAWIGLSAGLLASVAIAPLIRSLLFGVHPLDASVVAAVSMILAIVATLACTLPAWQAARLDPARTLRGE